MASNLRLINCSRTIPRCTPIFLSKSSGRITTAGLISGNRLKYATTTTTNNNTSTASIETIPRSEKEMSDLLAKITTREERKKIFEKLIGKQEIKNKKTDERPNEIKLKPIGRTKLSTDRFGIEVDQSPLNKLEEIYTNTLNILKDNDTKIPNGSVYRQSVENFTNQRLKIIQTYNQDIKIKEKKNKNDDNDNNWIEEKIKLVEKELDVEVIELAIEQAESEYELLLKMIKYQAWEDLVEKPEAGQWEYFAVPSSTSYPKD